MYNNRPIVLVLTNVCPEKTKSFHLKKILQFICLKLIIFGPSSSFPIIKLKLKILPKNRLKIFFFIKRQVVPPGSFFINIFILARFFLWDLYFVDYI